LFKSAHTFVQISPRLCSNLLLLLPVALHPF
jgi:hypothetical protein